MNWISLLFYYTVVTALTGDVMLLIWWICRMLFLRLNPDLIYYMLRWVVAMFVLPIAFAALLLSYKRNYVSEQRGFLENFVFSINFEKPYFHLIAGAWFLLTMYNIIRFSVKNLRRYQLFCGNIPEDDEDAIRIFYDVKKELKLRGKVKLVRNDLLGSPIVTGVLKRTVILPYRPYEEWELKVIFTHELTHFKKHDLVFKALAIWIVIFQSFNPPSYWISNILDQWSEQDCDRRVMERRAPEGLTNQDYFHVIWDMMMHMDKPMYDYYNFSMLFENEDSLERRVDFMKLHGKDFRKVSRIVTALLVAGFVMVSSEVSYAAGIGVAKVSDYVYKSTQTIDVADGTLLFKDAIEFTVSAEESALVEQVCPDGDGIMPADSDSFNWNIPIEKRYVTPLKWMRKDEPVSIAVVTTPSDALYWYGLMYPSNSCTVCEVTGTSSHVFDVPKSGFYRILVENRSDVEIHAVGGYSFGEDE